MTVKTDAIHLHIQGHAGMHDLTRAGREAVRRSGVQVIGAL
jgi:hypothetical protein